VNGARLLAGLLALIPAAIVEGQIGMLDLRTDRPDFTESALTVPRGSVQLEAGVTWERSDGGRQALSGPEALLRWGVATRLELRFESPEWTAASGDGLPPLRGDAAVGAKLQIGPLRAWDVAVIGGVTIPAGDDEASSDEIDPMLAVTAAHDLGEHWSLGVQAAAAWPTGDDGRRIESALTLVVGTDLGERGGTFLEVAATDPAQGGTAVVLHHGYTYQLGRAWQVDAHLGAGLSDDAPDFLVGVGSAVRF